MQQKRRVPPWTVMATALLSGHAAAQEAVQIYGTLNVDVESVEARGAAAAAPLPAGAMGANPTGIDVPRRNRVTQNSSNLGFRGSERVAPDVSAFFQVESGVAVDAGGSSIASRNTGVGFKSGTWGTVFVGQWDTPYKTLSGAVDPMFFTGITYTGALIGTPGFGVGPVTIGAPVTSADGRTFANTTNASFERRQGNSVQYWSPTVMGANLRIAYSANESRTSSSTGITPVNPFIWSASLDYQAGPFYVGYAHEAHADYFGIDALVPGAQATPLAASVAFAGASSRDRGEKLVARVKLGSTQLGVMAERLRFAKAGGNAVPGAFTRYERDAYVATLVQGIGAGGTLRALVGKARDGNCSRLDGSACVTSGLGGRQLSAGYSYSFSRRTDGYVFFTRVSNGARGSYQFANGAGLAAAPGSESVGYLLGLRHTF